MPHGADHGVVRRNSRLQNNFQRRPYQAVLILKQLNRGNSALRDGFNRFVFGGLVGRDK